MPVNWYQETAAPWVVPAANTYFQQGTTGAFGGLPTTAEGRETRALGALWNIMPQLGGAQAEWAARTLGGMANSLSQASGLTGQQGTDFYNNLVARGQFTAPSNTYAPGQYTAQLGRNINALSMLGGWLSNPTYGFGPSQTADYLRSVIAALGPWAPQSRAGAELQTWNKPTSYNEWMDFQRRMAQAAAIQAGGETPSYITALVRAALTPEEYYTMPIAFAGPPARRTSSWWQ